MSIKRDFKWKKKWDPLMNEGELLPRRGRRKHQKRRREAREAREIREKEYEITKEEEFRWSEESETEEDLMCISAHSVLMIPVCFETNNSLGIVQPLLDKIIEIDGIETSVWRMNDNYPEETNDLNRHFREFIGLHYKRVPFQRTWSCFRLKLNEFVLKNLFPVAKLRVLQEEQLTEYVCQFDSIELVVYPRGSCILYFNVDWKPQELELSICDMRTLIFVSKHLQNVERLFQGWCFTPPNTFPQISIKNPHQSIGADLFSARFENKNISLLELSQWLINFSANNHDMEPLDQIRNAYHHTSIVLEKEPTQELLYEYLFNIRRAFGQTNRPPINSEATLGKVLVWRRNRYLGISREGTVSISWPTPTPGSLEFEINAWHKRFLGIYLILAIHVQAEKLVFGDLSDLAADEAESWIFILEQPTLTQMKESRDKLRSLAAQLARYTLGMSSGDCGGTSEYSEFFVTLRNILGIPELRQELSQELKDVLAVVESNYLEEERRQRHHEEEKKREKFAIEQRFQQEKEDHDRKFETVISLIGAITLPFVIVAGVWGMNLTDLPHPPFWLLMSITGGASLGLFLLLAYSMLDYNAIFTRSTFSFRSNPYTPIQTIE